MKATTECKKEYIPSQRIQEKNARKSGQVLQWKSRKKHPKTHKKHREIKANSLGRPKPAPPYTDYP